MADWSNLNLELTGAVLSQYPGPAVLVQPDGKTLSANDSATALVENLRADPEGPLSKLVGVAARSQKPQTSQMRLSSDLGPVTFDVSAIPDASGRVVILAVDLTFETNLCSALVDSRERFKDLVDISSDFAWEVDKSRRFVYVSPKGALGYAAAYLVGRNPKTLLLSQPVQDEDTPFLTHTEVDSERIWTVSSSGAPVCLITTSAPLYDRNGEWSGARGMCRDVTAEEERESALARARNRERLLNQLVRSFRDKVDPREVLTGAAQALVQEMSAQGCRIFHLSQDMKDDGFADAFIAVADAGDTGGETLTTQLLSGLASGSEHLEMVLDGWQVLAHVTKFKQRINGALSLWRRGAAPPWGDDERILIGDISQQIGVANEQMAMHEKMRELSRTDPLTGLFNRRAFFEELERRYSRVATGHGQAALLFVDLDNFKLVNDVHGHNAGDKALLEVKRILLEHTRPSDLVARMGGDEFAIWLDNGDEHIAVDRARAILKASNALARFSGDPGHPLHLSLGIALHDPERPENLEELLHRADGAMYDAKRKSKATYCIAPEMGDNGEYGEGSYCVDLSLEEKNDP